MGDSLVAGSHQPLVVGGQDQPGSFLDLFPGLAQQLAPTVLEDAPARLVQPAHGADQGLGGRRRQLLDRLQPVAQLGQSGGGGMPGKAVDHFLQSLVGLQGGGPPLRRGAAGI